MRAREPNITTPHDRVVKSAQGTSGRIHRQFNVDEREKVAIVVKGHRPEALTDRNTEIFTRYAKGDISLRALAEEYGVSKSRINELVRKARRLERRKQYEEIRSAMPMKRML